MNDRIVDINQKISVVIPVYNEERFIKALSICSDFVSR